MYSAPDLSTELEDAALPLSVAERPLRVLYAAGPGDVIGTFRHWQAGREDPSSVALTYSEQFYNTIRALGADAYVIAQRGTGRLVCDRSFVLEDRHNPLSSAGGVRFHLGQLWYGLRLWGTAVRFGADAAIVSGGTHWFVLSLLALSGVRVVPTLHCALWPAGHRPRGRLRRAIQWLDGLFWRRLAHATICVSPECERQVREIARGRALRGPVYQVRAQYRRDTLDAIAPPRHARPLRVLFAGRIERGKGVFDLLEVVGQLERSRPGDFTLEFCGGGSALEALREAVERRGLSHIVRVSGQQNADGVRHAFARAHVVVVPTNREFTEGLNKVVVEAVLAGRPVIASRLAHAGDVLQGAIIEVPPGDVAACGAALERLADDPAAYAAARAACAAAQPMFYDRSLGWQNALWQIIAPESASIPSPAKDNARLPRRTPRGPSHTADAWSNENGARPSRGAPRDESRWVRRSS